MKAANTLTASWRQALRPGYLTPWRVGRNLIGHIQRQHAQRLLTRIPAARPLLDGRVLVDGMWDNPNYWLRFALIRAALGLTGRHNVGVVGRYRVRPSVRSLTAFGITNIFAMGAPERADSFLRPAASLLRRATTADELLQLELPHRFPADFLYDGVLKRQRAATVDMRDEQLPHYVAEALASLSDAERILDGNSFELLLLSHAIDFRYAALAWLAAERRIPVVVLFGNYGVARYTRISSQSDVYDTTDRPNAEELRRLTPDRARMFAQAGQAYLAKRRAGMTGDIGAREAFQKPGSLLDRRRICDHFGWNASTPIIAVYASNWFDYPHAAGMTHFRDFLDWIETTLAAAQDNTSVNWLFRAHPCDQWYGGVTLRDLVPDEPSGHVRQSPMDWNGSAVMDAVDGLVTYHGTAGIEYAAVGKPVLTADRGWYHDHGFVRWPRTRQEYMSCLASEWWRDVDLSASSALASAFAGWYFCRPQWQETFTMLDDSAGESIYRGLPKLLDQILPVSTELQTIRRWFSSPSLRYHTYKMSISESIVAGPVLTLAEGQGKSCQ